MKKLLLNILTIFLFSTALILPQASSRLSLHNVNGWSYSASPFINRDTSNSGMMLRFLPASSDTVQVFQVFAKPDSVYNYMWGIPEWKTDAYFQKEGFNFHYPISAIVEVSIAEKMNVKTIEISLEIQNGEQAFIANDSLKIKEGVQVMNFDFSFATPATPSLIFKVAIMGISVVSLDTTYCGTQVELNNLRVMEKSENGTLDTIFIDLFGGQNTVGVVDPLPGIPTGFHLYQNYPNPFNPSTIISYNLHSWSFVTLKKYDNLGKEVKTIVNKFQNAGTHSVSFNAKDLPSGIYFYRLKGNNFSETKKLVLIK
jgi:Secretion system C-terminal sorting domain